MQPFTGQNDWTMNNKQTKTRNHSITYHSTILRFIHMFVLTALQKKVIPNTLLGYTELYLIVSFNCPALG